MLSTRAQENLTGIRVIRAYAQEKPEIAAFDQANRDYVDRNIKLIGTLEPVLPRSFGADWRQLVIILLGMGGMQVIDQQRVARHVLGVLHVSDSACLSR